MDKGTNREKVKRETRLKRSPGFADQVRQKLLAQRRLAHLIELASFPNGGLSVHIQKPGAAGAREPESAVLISVNDRKAIYGPTIEEALDKSIRYSEFERKQKEKLKEFD